MDKDARSFLDQLLKTPSVSGFEQRIQRVVRERAAAFADEIRVDVHGNLIASLNPGAPLRVMLAGHCDQIGLMVTYIDDKGFLRMNQVGGIDHVVLPGLKVVIHTKDGPIEGVIGHKPVHLTPQSERGKKVELKKLWIDIGAKDGKEAKAAVRIGDPVTFRLGATDLREHRIAAAGCDDRVGVFVAMEALRRIAERRRAGEELAVGLYAVSTVQEELGLRGARTAAYGIDPRVGIAVDVTHASDNPGADEKEIGAAELGKGPVIARGANINPVVEELLIKAAEKKEIPHQLRAAPSATGTDANAMQITRSGVAAALVGIPNRYMHTPVEIIDLRDLAAAVELLAETVMMIKADTDFTPV